jgi:alpha-mannosidase
VHIIPQSHIDVEWFWNYEETIARSMKIFSSVLKMLRKHSDYCFSQGQVAILQPVMNRLGESDREYLLNAIREGRFEVVGGMWVQPDSQTVHGEVLVRQALYGLRWFKNELGVDVKCAWNVDVFGQCVQLPQILSKSGFKYFVFARGVPREIAETMPSEFYYQSPDGSKILTHWMPRHYGGRRGIELKFATKWNMEFYKTKEEVDSYASKAVTKNMLIPYGVDVNVPNEDIFDNIELFNKELEEYEFIISTPSKFFEKVEKEKEKIQAFTHDFNLPLRSMDLRGCWDSRPELRKMHRKSELLLLSSEKFASLAMLLGAKYPAEKLGESWEMLLFNCFHDILGGSHTDDVYVAAMQRYSDANGIAKSVLYAALNWICERIDTSGGSGRPIAVFNQLSWTRTDLCQINVEFKQGEIIEVGIQDWEGNNTPLQVSEEERYSDGSLKRAKLAFAVKGVPPLGYKTYYLTSKAKKEVETTLKASEGVLENKWFRVEFDESGGIARIFDKQSDLEVLDTSLYLGNELITQSHAGDLEGVLNLKEDIWRMKDYKCGSPKVEVGPVSAQMQYTGEFKSAERKNKVILYNDLRRIDFETEVDLKEPQFFIRTRFPFAFRKYETWYETPYAPLKRPEGHYAAQTWVCLQTPNYGLSLINTGNPGYWVSDGNLDLVLEFSVDQVREKDPKTGRYKHPYDAPLARELGKHTFRYSLYPHKGTWREAKTTRLGQEINNPLIPVQTTPHKGPLPPQKTLLKIKPGNLIITSIKKSEEKDDLVIRGYESEGEPGKATLDILNDVKSAWTADLNEKKLNKMQSEGAEVYMDFKPYEIFTVLLKT